jgi:hypothetical protein
MAEILVKPAGKFVLLVPQYGLPQYTTVPSSFRARLPDVPAATVTTFDTSAGTIVSGDPGSPHAITADAAFASHADPIAQQTNSKAIPRTKLLHEIPLSGDTRIT